LGLTPITRDSGAARDLRYNPTTIALDTPDGFVDITNVARLTGLFGQAC